MCVCVCVLYIYIFMYIFLEDWKNEEYTGSLANSQMYTSSGTSNSPPINSCIILGGTSSIISDDFDVSFNFCFNYMLM